MKSSLVCATVLQVVRTSLFGFQSGNSEPGVIVGGVSGSVYAHVEPNNSEP
jgi:hypothetical protein